MANRKPPMDLDQWKEKITAGGFQTLGFVRRAIAHSKLGKAERKTVLLIADDYFTKNPATLRNAKTTRSSGRRKVTKRNGKKPDMALGINGIGTDGEGDCLAVTMCVIAHDPKMRDSINRMLSQAREEGDLTLPVLSSRFARICRIASRAHDR
jgi:hypothetical protein